MSRYLLSAHNPPECRRPNRQGVITVWIILAVPAFALMMCIVLEIGHIWLARVELENALEAAALAGVKVWSEQSKNETSSANPDYDGKPHANPDDPTILANVRLATQQAFAANLIRGQTYSLDANSGPINGSPPLNHGNASLDGEIVLGSFPNNASRGTLTENSDVGCGRSRMTSVPISVTLLPVIQTNDTFGDPEAFQITLQDGPMGTFTGSITKITIDVRNDDADTSFNTVPEEDDMGNDISIGPAFNPKGDGVFDPGGGASDAAGYGPIITGPSMANPNYVDGANVTSDLSQVSDGVLIFEFDKDEWRTASNPMGAGHDTFVFGIDTDGVGDDEPNISDPDDGGDFGDPGNTNGTRTGRLSITYELTVNVSGTDQIVTFEQSGFQSAGMRSEQLGNSRNLNSSVTKTINIANNDFAVLTRKTLSINSLCGNLFGVTIPTYTISATATAAARCDEDSSEDPDVNNPRLVHATDVQ